MVKNVRFISQEGFVPQRSFHHVYALFVFFECKIGETLFVEELRVTIVDV